MQLSRRLFLSGLGALPLATLMSRPAISQITLGTSTLTTVSDGYLTLPRSFLIGDLVEEDVADVLTPHGLGTGQLTPECNLALYRDGTNKVLFDAGSGADFMPTAGQIVDSLEAVGEAPEDITHVVFTHAHPDHIWGVIDEFDDPLFYEAVHMMGRAEWDYWWNPETVNTIGDARAAFAVGAKRRMEAIEDNVVLFDDGDEILSGIAALASYGHTPGHMSFEVRSGNNAALVVGDAIGNHHLAFERPDWQTGADQDGATAVASRRMLFDRLTADDLALVGFHLPMGGIGRAEAIGDGYRFVPGAA